MECYLTLLDYGVRAGGGIGDLLPMISFKNNPSYFMSRFFYNITFHIFIILILGNIFFGIIVDTFADLRDKNEAIDKDKRNVCFICQLNRNNSINQNIDYDKHISEDHKLWNYVYFLTYLHMNNPNDFSALENFVWDKFQSKDIMWIPNFSSINTSVAKKEIS